MSVVRDSDRGVSKLVALLTELERGVKVTVGVHADTGAAPHRGASGATVGEVATFAEFGTDVEAPHSFLRSVIDGERPRLEQGLARAGALAIRSAQSGSPRDVVAKSVRRVSSLAAALVRRRVRALGLRDTGHLEQSIEARLVERGDAR